MTGYHIIMDSVGDRTDELLEMDNFSVVPLTIIIDDEEFIDDNSLDQQMLIDKIAVAKECPRSACASPGKYQSLYEQHKDERIYVITASSELTGSYNSAKLGKELFMEEHPDAEIVVIDSRSASAGQTLLVYKIMEFEKAQNNFKTVIQKIREFIKDQEIIFVLEDLTFLQKNGRLTGLQSLLATALSIVPILKGDDGVIAQMGKVRGIKRALKNLMEVVVGHLKKAPKDMLVISHCNCIERANNLKQELISLFPYLDIKIVDTGGIATLYAGDRGIVVSY